MSGQPERHAIFDLGANAGDFGIDSALRNLGHTVVCIEPIEELSDAIERRALAAGLANLLVERVAVDATARTAEFHVARLGDFGISSLYSLDASTIKGDEYWNVRDDLRFTDTTTVTTVTLESLIVKHGVDVIDFIKIDVQGLDLIALESAGPLVGRIRAGMLEVPAAVRRRLYAEEDQSLEMAYATLRRLGFEVEFIKPNDPACNEVNVYFVRAGESLGDIEEELGLRGISLYGGKHYWARPCANLAEVHAADSLAAEVTRLGAELVALAAELAADRSTSERLRERMGAEVARRRVVEGTLEATRVELLAVENQQGALRRRQAAMSRERLHARAELAEEVAARESAVRDRDEMRRQLLAADALLYEMRTSTSWKVTSGIRTVGRVGRRILRRRTNS